jgi:hypothetical protein
MPNAPETTAAEPYCFKEREMNSAWRWGVAAGLISGLCFGWVARGLLT